MAIINTNEVTPEQIALVEDIINAEAIARRFGTPSGKNIGAAGSAGTIGAEVIRQASQSAIGKSIMQEYQDVREDTAGFDNRIQALTRTYENYLNKTNNPIEMFIDQPNYYAALTTQDGEDVVWWDSTAPQNSHFAHELGHIEMNHSSDPLAWLQTSGVGKRLHHLAMPLGAAGAVIGAARGRTVNRRLAGSAIGGAVGTALASGNTIYELEASRRGLGYIEPEDTSVGEYLGDVVPAGSTYALAGPVAAAGSALAAGTAANYLSHPDRYIRRA